jgi:hypothetical protein
VESIDPVLVDKESENSEEDNKKSINTEFSCYPVFSFEMQSSLKGKSTRDPVFAHFWFPGSLI